MATGRLAVLSNVNMNMVIRMLQKQAEVYDAEGYGNELGGFAEPGFLLSCVSAGHYLSDHGSGRTAGT